MRPAVDRRADSLGWSRRGLFAALLFVALAKVAKAEGKTVEIRQFKFAPDEIAIPAGGTVTFINLDLVPHTATAESFDTGSLRQDERKEIVFPEAGTFPYYCKFHRHMTGRVVVR
jgi:plastocyanin